LKQILDKTLCQPAWLKSFLKLRFIILRGDRNLGLVAFAESGSYFVICIIRNEFMSDFPEQGSSLAYIDINLRRMTKMNQFQNDIMQLNVSDFTASEVIPLAPHGQSAGDQARLCFSTCFTNCVSACFSACFTTCFQNCFTNCFHNCFTTCVSTCVQNCFRCGARCR